MAVPFPILQSQDNRHSPPLSIRRSSHFRDRRKAPDFPRDPNEPTHTHATTAIITTYSQVSTLQSTSARQCPTASESRQTNPNRRLSLHHVRSVRARAPEQLAPGRALGQGLCAARRHHRHLRQCAGPGRHRLDGRSPATSTPGNLYNADLTSSPPPSPIPSPRWERRSRAPRDGWAAWRRPETRSPYSSCPPSSSASSSFFITSRSCSSKSAETYRNL